MRVRYPAVRDLVIVLSDLYWSAATEAKPEREIDVPALERVSRFGEATLLGEGWRTWLARRMGFSDALRATPADAVAELSKIAGANPLLTGSRGTTSAWVAQPVHWLASLSTLHLDRRGILLLSATELVRLAADFNATFADSPYRVQPLDSGELLVTSATPVDAVTVNPARCVGTDFSVALPGGEGGGALRRLGSEIEMWLHDHPLNRERQQRRAPPISGLWFWDGREPATVNASHISSLEKTLVLGHDWLIDALNRRQGYTPQPLPDILAPQVIYPTADAASSMVFLIRTTDLLNANAAWTLDDVLIDIDSRYLAPAVQALAAGNVQRVSIIANDRQLLLQPRDHWKLWRPRKPGVSGLQ